MPEPVGMNDEVDHVGQQLHARGRRGHDGGEDRGERAVDEQQGWSGICLLLDWWWIGDCLPRRWHAWRSRTAAPGSSGAEDGGGDAQPGGGAGVAGLVLGVGDLAGDGAELGGDRRRGGGYAFEGVEDLVVLAAARGEHGDDVFDAGALDVGDVGLHRATRGAGRAARPTRCSSPLGSHGRSRWTRQEAVWRLWPSWPIRDRHSTPNSRRRSAA